LTILPQIYLYPHISDDAYISFRYADRLASGQGLTFNPDERVEGYSNPLWTLLISATVWLTPFVAPDIARFFGLLFTILTVLSIWHLFCRNINAASKDIPNFIVCMALVLSNPGFHVYATAGLEGPLLMFLLTFCATLSLKDKKSSYYLTALAYGLVGITRPEGILYGLLWYLCTLKLKNNNKLLIRYEAQRMAIFLLPFIAYQIFRYYYFDTFQIQP
jgi:hypothetical protein